ncbi:MAG: sensor histidine kinase [Spirochaetaceae bacterium]|nr:sensor histidine kinase [Spirochaetaceae bacterium]
MKLVRIQDSLVRAFAVLIVLTIVLLGSTALSFLQRTLVDAAKASASQFAAQIGRVVEDYITYMDDIALVVMGDEDVRSYMELSGADRDRGGDRGLGLDGGRVAAFLSSIRSVRKDIDGIFLLPEAEGGGVLARAVVASAPGGRVNPYFDFDGRFIPLAARLEAADGGPALSSAHVETMVEGRYPWVISLVRRASERGYIQVDLNYAIIERLCRDVQLGASGYVFILGPQGDIVYHPRQQLLYGGLRSERIDELAALRDGSLSARVDGRDVLYAAVSSGRTGWIVVAASYVDELLAGSRQAAYSFVLLALLCFAVSVAVASFIATRISRPIEALRRSMQEVERGNFDMEITVECRNEVYQLARDCDIAVKTVRNLIEENRRESEQKRVLELRALQSQINPHFLYNTLDSIVWMIELGENEAAIDVTTSLARFFRLGLSRGSEIITIRTEIDYLETYLSIQKMRYKKKLGYELAFEPEIYGFKILKLLVQPLVENAIYHGIKNKESPGLVRVSGSLEDGTLVIRVRDDGVGMDGSELDALRASLAPEDEGGTAEGGTATGGPAVSAPAPSLGVGVRNVEERVRLYFGSEYGLSFDSEKGVGTVATLRIPPIREAEP